MPLNAYACCVAGVLRRMTYSRWLNSPACITSVDNRDNLQAPLAGHRSELPLRQTAYVMYGA